MEYKILDAITFCELTLENFVRCLDGYLDTVIIPDKDTVLDLVTYLEYAFSSNDKDLIHFALERIRATMLGH